MLLKLCALTLRKAVNAQGFEQFLYVAKLSFISSIIPFIGEEFNIWYIENIAFLKWIFIILIVDHILGSIVHLFIQKDFKMKANLIGLLQKAAVIIFGYLILESMHSIMRDIEFIELYFKVVIQISLLIYPGLSALRNLHIVSGGKFPPKWLFSNLETFNETGDLTVFKQKIKKANGKDFTDQSEHENEL